MNDNNEAITIRYDLDEYIEDIVNGLSDEEYQEAIDFIGHEYFNRIIKPKHIKRYLRRHIRKMILSSLEE